MKKQLFTFLLSVGCGFLLSAQDVESYTALKVTGDNVPVIDGTIESVWDNVEMVPLTKVPEQGGQIHPNITVPNPTAADYSAEIGMVWNDDGIFFCFKVVDDLLLIEDDYDPNNSTPADQWWTDDNINLLFSKDLINGTFQQWEFAWQPGIDQEEKLSSDRWLNAAQIDSQLVSSAWFNDGTTWILETFIDWGAFADGNANIFPGMEIFLEARARDDDDGGAWESMYQWSTTNYDVEGDGVGLGAVTLSDTELVTTGIRAMAGTVVTLYPNPSHGLADLDFSLPRSGQVAVSVYDLAGRNLQQVTYDHLSAGPHTVQLDLTSLQQGLYYVQLTTTDHTGVAKLIKR
jgi:hypothetical protein